MTTRSLSCQLSALLLATSIGCSSTVCADEVKAKSSESAQANKYSFEARRVWQVLVELSPDQFAAMQPRGQGGFPGPGARFGRPTAPPEGGDVHRNQFGVDLPWAVGQVAIGDQTFNNVGIRYKGNGTIMDANGSIKKSLKFDFDRNGETATFLGMKTINLHCGVTDPSKCRETLAYRLYRECGVPASRTALAEVRLTVPGKYENELLGLYTVVEHVGDAFLRTHFGSDDGLLMKPENVRDLEYSGDDWSVYQERYSPERDVVKEEAQRVIDLSKLVHKSDDATFAKDIASYLDVDGYLRFLAATAYLANSDSFFGLGHNYYLYLHPETKKFHFIPWDLDRAFANFFIFGTHEQQMDLSLKHPYAGSHRLTERLLAIPEVNARYELLLKQLADEGLDEQRLLGEVESLAHFTQDYIDREQAAAKARGEGSDRPRGFGPSIMAAAPPELATFVVKRTASLDAQLAGASEGYVPQGGFGPPGMGGPMPKVGDMMAMPFLAVLDADEDGKLARTEWIKGSMDVFKDAQQKAKDGIDERTIATALDDRFPKGPDGRPMGPPGFSLGGMMAGRIVERADANANGKVAVAELTESAGEIFDRFDPECLGKIDQAAFSKLLTELFALER